MATESTTPNRSITGNILSFLSVMLVIAAPILFQLARNLTTTIYSPLADVAFLVAIPLAIIALVVGLRVVARIVTILSSLALLGLVVELVVYLLYVVKVIH